MFRCSPAGNRTWCSPTSSLVTTLTWLSRLQFVLHVLMYWTDEKTNEYIKNMLNHLYVSRTLWNLCVCLVQLYLFLALGFVFLLYIDIVCFFFEVCRNDLYNQNVCLEIWRAVAHWLWCMTQSSVAIYWVG